MNIDAIITARSGSKGIYKKNTILLDSKPLIEYTLEAAFGAAFIRHVYLSTDDEALFERYKNYKEIRFIDRPKALADDQISLKDVLAHALETIRANNPDLIIILLPTSPLRTSSHIDAAVKFAQSLPSFDSIVSVSRVKIAPLGGLILDKYKRTRFLFKKAQKYYRRQDQPPVYKLAGAIWIVAPDKINKLNDFLLSGESYAFELNDSENIDIDIDTPCDVAVAEAMLSFQKERVSWDARGGFNVQRFYAHDDLEMGIRRNILDAAAYERHLQRYRFFLDYIEPSDVVLDIACGSGYGSEILASKARLVYGIDMDAKTIEYARRHHLRSNIRFDVSTVESFIPKERHDKIISVETIEHLADPEGFLVQAKEWLKPDGVLWLTCPLSESDSQQIENPFHISNISYDKLSILMNRHFKEVDFFSLSEQDIFRVDTLNNRTTYIVAKGSLL
ncbi:MAG: methyltransferase domain-containing protein [Nitrospirae bacterium]|nr:methyltransferase domain-containing protein [Nitrospirota bacterium]